MSKLVMPSKYLILCCPLLLLPSIIPSIRVFSNESALCIRWPKYWSFSFSIRISPSNEYSGLISIRIESLISFQSKGLSRVFSNTTVQKHLQTYNCMLLLLLSHFSRVLLCATPSTAAHQAPLSLGFSRQEHWSGLPFPSPMHERKSESEA